MKARSLFLPAHVVGHAWFEQHGSVPRTVRGTEKQTRVMYLMTDSHRINHQLLKRFHSNLFKAKGPQLFDSSQSVSFVLITSQFRFLALGPLHWIYMVSQSRKWENRKEYIGFLIAGGNSFVLLCWELDLTSTWADFFVDRHIKNYQIIKMCLRKLMLEMADASISQNGRLGFGKGTCSRCFLRLLR